MKLFSNLVKKISWVVIAALCAEQLAYADGVFKPEKLAHFSKPEFKLELPESVAVAEDFYLADRKTKDASSDPLSAKRYTLFLIQDAHTNESAQINIAKVLEHLHQKEKIKYVFLEAGTGDDSLSSWRSKAAKPVREKVAKQFLRQGELSGAEFLDLSSDLDIQLWGVENKKLYYEAVEAYKAVADKREFCLDYLQKSFAAAQALKSEIFNPLLRDFDTKRMDYLSGKISFGDFTDLIAKETAKTGQSLKDYPHLTRLFEIKRKELEIDFEAANQEQQKALLALPEAESRELRELSGKLSAKKVSSGNFDEMYGYYSLLKERLGNHDMGYPNLSKYFTYLRLSRSFSAEKVMEELDTLVDRIYQAYTVTPGESKLHAADKNLRTLESLIRLTLTPGEYKKYKNQKELSGIHAIMAFLNRQIAETDSHYERAIFLERDFDVYVKKAERFYELTLERDRAFVGNILKKVGQDRGKNKKSTVHNPQSNIHHPRRAVALITGGYHTPNLKALLREKGISYVSIRPAVYRETNQKRYEKILFDRAFDRKSTLLAAPSTVAPKWINALPFMETKQANFRLESAFNFKPKGARASQVVSSSDSQKNNSLKDTLRKVMYFIPQLVLFIISILAYDDISLAHEWMKLDRPSVEQIEFISAFLQRYPDFINKHGTNFFGSVILFYVAALFAFSRYSSIERFGESIPLRYKTVLKIIALAGLIFNFGAEWIHTSGEEGIFDGSDFVSGFLGISLAYLLITKLAGSKPQNAGSRLITRKQTLNLLVMGSALLGVYFLGPDIIRYLDQKAAENLFFSDGAFKLGILAEGLAASFLSLRLTIPWFYEALAGAEPARAVSGRILKTTRNTLFAFIPSAFLWMQPALANYFGETMPVISDLVFNAYSQVLIGIPAGLIFVDILSQILTRFKSSLFSTWRKTYYQGSYKKMAGGIVISAAILLILFPVWDLIHQLSHFAAAAWLGEEAQISTKSVWLSMFFEYREPDLQADGFYGGLLSSNLSYFGFLSLLVVRMAPNILALIAGGVVLKFALKRHSVAWLTASAWLFLWPFVLSWPGDYVLTLQNGQPITGVIKTMPEWLRPENDLFLSFGTFSLSLLIATGILSKFRNKSAARLAGEEWRESRKWRAESGKSSKLGAQSENGGFAARMVDPSSTDEGGDSGARLASIKVDGSAPLTSIHKEYVSNGNRWMLLRRQQFAAAYRNHIESSRKLILAGAEGLSGTAVILGLGNGTEFTNEGLETLARQFDKIYVYDLDFQAARKTIQTLNSNLRSKFIVRYWDLTGILGSAARRVEEIIQNSSQPILALDLAVLFRHYANALKNQSRLWPNPSPAADYIVSSLVMTELSEGFSGYITSLIEKKHSKVFSIAVQNNRLFQVAFNELRKALQLKHARELRLAVKPRGRVYLSNTSQVALTKDGKRIATQALITSQANDALDSNFAVDRQDSWEWNVKPEDSGNEGKLYDVEAAVLKPIIRTRDIVGRGARLTGNGGFAARMVDPSSTAEGGDSGARLAETEMNIGTVIQTLGSPFSNFSLDSTISRSKLFDGWFDSLNGSQNLPLRFFVLDGTPGAGRSTLAKDFHGYLLGRGIPVKLIENDKFMSSTMRKPWQVVLSMLGALTLFSLPIIPASVLRLVVVRATFQHNLFSHFESELSRALTALSKRPGAELDIFFQYLENHLKVAVSRERQSDEWNLTYGTVIIVEGFMAVELFRNFSRYVIKKVYVGSNESTGIERWRKRDLVEDGARPTIASFFLTWSLFVRQLHRFARAGLYLYDQVVTLENDDVSLYTPSRIHSAARLSKNDRDLERWRKNDEYYFSASFEGAAKVKLFWLWAFVDRRTPFQFRVFNRLLSLMLLIQVGVLASTLLVMLGVHIKQNWVIAINGFIIFFMNAYSFLSLHQPKVYLLLRSRVLRESFADERYSNDVERVRLELNSLHEIILFISQKKPETIGRFIHWIDPAIEAASKLLYENSKDYANDLIPLINIIKYRVGLSLPAFESPVAALKPFLNLSENPEIEEAALLIAASILSDHRYHDFQATLEIYSILKNKQTGLNDGDLKAFIDDQLAQYENISNENEGSSGARLTQRNHRALSLNRGENNIEGDDRVHPVYTREELPWGFSDALHASGAGNEEQVYPHALIDLLGQKPSTYLKPVIIGDLGSGEGGLARLVSRSSGYSVVGFEKKKELVRKAQNEARKEGFLMIQKSQPDQVLDLIENVNEPTVAFIPSDLEQGIPLKDESLDAVLFHRIFSMIGDQAKLKKIIKDARRTLKPGGLVSYFDFEPLYNSESKLRGYKNLEELGRRLLLYWTENGLITDAYKKIALDERIRPIALLHLIDEDSRYGKKSELLNNFQKILEFYEKGYLQINIVFHLDREYVKSLFVQEGFDILQDQETYITNRKGGQSKLGGFVAVKKTKLLLHGARLVLRDQNIASNDPLWGRLSQATFPNVTKGLLQLTFSTYRIDGQKFRGRILIAGAGRNWEALTDVSALAPQATVIAIEQDEDAVKHLRERALKSQGHHIQIYRADARNLKSFLDDDQIDIVLFPAVLDLYQTPSEKRCLVEILKESHRILKPGGILSAGAGIDTQTIKMAQGQGFLTQDAEEILLARKNPKTAAHPSSAARLAGEEWRESRKWRVESGKSSKLGAQSENGSFVVRTVDIGSRIADRGSQSVAQLPASGNLHAGKAVKSALSSIVHSLSSNQSSEPSGARLGPQMGLDEEKELLERFALKLWAFRHSRLDGLEFAFRLTEDRWVRVDETPAQDGLPAQISLVISPETEQEIRLEPISDPEARLKNLREKEKTLHVHEIQASDVASEILIEQKRAMVFGEGEAVSYAIQIDGSEIAAIQNPVARRAQLEMFRAAAAAWRQGDKKARFWVVNIPEERQAEFADVLTSKAGFVDGFEGLTVLARDSRRWNSSQALKPNELLISYKDFDGLKVNAWIRVFGLSRLAVLAAAPAYRSSEGLDRSQMTTDSLSDFETYLRSAVKNADKVTREKILSMLNGQASPEELDELAVILPVIGPALAAMIQGARLVQRSTGLSA